MFRPLSQCRTARCPNKGLNRPNTAAGTGTTVTFTAGTAGPYTVSATIDDTTYNLSANGGASVSVPQGATINAPNFTALSSLDTVSFTGSSAISISDPGAVDVVMSLLVSDGALSVSSNPSVAQSTTPEGTGMVLNLFGTPAAIDNVLSSLAFNSSDGLQATLTLEVSDSVNAPALTFATLGSPDDPVVGAPRAVSFASGATGIFTGTSALSVSDSYVSSLLVSLEVGAGTLSLSGSLPSGVSYTGSGSEISLSGPISGVNAALAELVCTGAAGGATTLLIEPSDQGALNGTVHESLAAVALYIQTTGGGGSPIVGPSNVRISGTTLVSSGAAVSLSVGYTAGTSTSDTISWNVTSGGTQIATGTGANIAFTAGAAGASYIASATVSDTNGLSSSATAQVNVATPGQPVGPSGVTFTGSTNVNQGDAVSLTIGYTQGTDPNDTVTWTVTGVDGAQIAYGTATSIGFTAGDDGPYQVTATVTDTNGTATGSATVAVNSESGGGNAGPSVSINTEDDVDEGYQIAASTDTSGFSPGATLVYTWDVTAPDNSEIDVGTAPSMVFTANQQGTYAVDLTVEDVASGSTATDSVMITSAAAVNIGMVVLNAVDEAGGPDINGGTQIQDFTDDFGDTLTSENGVAEGIAITNVDTADGSWQYSADNGVDWKTLPVVNTSSALLLDGKAHVRFLPSPYYIGSLSDALDFQAWDGAAGKSDQLVNTTENPFAQALSPDSSFATINIIPVVSVTAAGASITVSVDEPLPSDLIVGVSTSATLQTTLFGPSYITSGMQVYDVQCGYYLTASAPAQAWTSSDDLETDVLIPAGNVSATLTVHADPYSVGGIMHASISSAPAIPAACNTTASTAYAVSAENSEDITLDKSTTPEWAEIGTDAIVSPNDPVASAATILNVTLPTAAGASWSTSNGTASAGTDYTECSGTLDPNGSFYTTISIPIAHVENAGARFFYLIVQGGNFIGPYVVPLFIQNVLATAQTKPSVQALTIDDTTAGWQPGGDVNPGSGMLPSGSTAYIPWDNDDDDNNGSPDYKDTAQRSQVNVGQVLALDNNLLPIEAQQGGEAGGFYTLDYPTGKYRIFKESPDGTLTLFHNDEHLDFNGPGINKLTLYVQATSMSQTELTRLVSTSDTMTLVWHGGAGQTVSSDPLKIIRFYVNGARSVPGATTYTYTFPGIGNIGTTSNGTAVVASGASSSSEDITWPQGPTFGKVRFSPSHDYTWAFDVAVVNVTVDTSDSQIAVANQTLNGPSQYIPYLQGGNGAFTRTRTGFISSTSDWQQADYAAAASGSPAATLADLVQAGVTFNPAMTATANISISGPSRNGAANRDYGVQYIQVGFTQTLTFMTFDYRIFDPVTGATTVLPIRNGIGGPPLQGVTAIDILNRVFNPQTATYSNLDLDPNAFRATRQAWPWADVESALSIQGDPSVFNSSIGQSVSGKTLSITDTPMLGLDTLRTFVPFLAGIEAAINFGLNLAVTTTDPTGWNRMSQRSQSPVTASLRNSQYWVLASGGWAFNGSGVFGGGIFPQSTANSVGAWLPIQGVTGVSYTNNGQFTAPAAGQPMSNLNSRLSTLGITNSSPIANTLVNNARP